MNIVAVNFESRKEPGMFYGKEYSYNSAINLKVGDMVLVPSNNGESRALVKRVGIDESELNFEPSLLKTIEKLAEKQEV